MTAIPAFLLLMAWFRYRRLPLIALGNGAAISVFLPTFLLGPLLGHAVILLWFMGIEIWHLLASPAQRSAVAAQHQAEQQVQQQRLADLDAAYDSLVVVKTYGEHQQWDLTRDLARLVESGIRFSTRRGPIASIYVHPQDAERALALVDPIKPGANRLAP